MIRAHGKRVAALFIVLAVLFTFPHGAAAAKKYLSLATGNPGGTFYFIGAGFANLFNKHVPDVRVIAESTAASEENFHYVIRKKVDMGLISIHVIDPALEKKMDLSGVRLMCLGHTSDRHWFVRRDSPIKSVSDFKGKRVALGSPGSGTLVSSKVELGAAGKLSIEDIKPAYLSFTESITAIKDGTVDVGVISAGYPVASLLDLARTVPMRLIPYSEAELKALMDAHPYYVKVVIPAGTYTGIDTDTLTRGIVTAIFCRKEMSDDLVYAMMKALYDHQKEKDAIHPQARQWSLENMFRGADYTTKYIPFHPGSVKYLKEKGVWKQ
ncbi:MAG TPA: TAXI family TRAP transporter solute-binding subunit [Thermodesulfobacteriota bacterium]|nr:TAXI family TRAP transporter solute-binding subunit [Thermodesulfobacteriota bacterium]